MNYADWLDPVKRAAHWTHVNAGYEETERLFSEWLTRNSDKETERERIMELGGHWIARERFEEERWAHLR